VIEYPADTVKVRLQTQVPDAVTGKLQFSGALDCFKQTLKKDGLLGFYRGLASPIYGAMLENAALFLAYEQVRRFVTRDGTPFDYKYVALAGASAGLGTTMVLTPVELVKCRLQMLQDPTQGVVSLVRKIVKAEGVRGMYTGVGSTFCRELPGNCVWFLTYEFLSRQFGEMRRRENGGQPAPVHMWQQILAGGVAGCMYWLVPFPIDTAKSVLQTTTDKSLTLRTALLGLYRRGGVGALYNGVSLTMMRAFPTNAIIFLMYKEFNNLLDRVI